MIFLPLLGINYTSKLDEFEVFVERIRKYGLIPSASTRESKSSIILLIDDLPMTNGKVAFGRLKKCLHLLVQSTRIPTAILLTDYGNTDSADQSAKYLEELQLCLESAGACKVTFLGQISIHYYVLLLLNAHFKLDLEVFRLLSILLQIIPLRRHFLEYADKSGVM